MTNDLLAALNIAALTCSLMYLAYQMGFSHGLSMAEHSKGEE